MSPNQAFGITLREYRLAKGYTQELLAERAGLDSTTISRYERGIRAPLLDTLFLVANGLGLPPEEFFECMIRNLKNAR